MISLFLIYQVIILIWVEPSNIAQAIDYSFKYIYFLVPFLLWTSFPIDKIYHLIYSFLLAMAVASFQSLLLYFHIYDAKTKIANSLSLHMWHTYYSIFLAFSSLVIFAHIKYIKSYRYYLYILSLMIVSVLFLGVARTGQVLFLVGLAYTLIYRFKLKIKNIVAIFTLISILLYGLYKIDPIFKNRVDLAKSDIVSIYKGDYCSSLGMRLFTWKIAGEVLRSDPLLGLGSIDHLDYLNKRLDNNPQTSNCAIRSQISNFHSQYIETFAQSGIIGLLLLLSLFIRLSKIVIKDSFISYIRTLFIVTFLYDFLLEYPFRVSSMLGLFVIFSSIILLESKKEQ